MFARRLVIVCMVLLRAEGLEKRASGWRQRRNRARGVHVDRRTDVFPTVRLRCSRLLGLVSQLDGVATQQNVRRQCLGIGDLEDNLRDLGRVTVLAAPVALHESYARA